MLIVVDESINIELFNPDAFGSTIMHIWLYCIIYI